MSWQILHPEALLFLLLAPLLLLLHLARRRPASFPTPFLKIWERAQPRRGGGFKRLQDLLALLIILILLLLVTAALARPFLPPPEPEHVMILLDDSASMSAVNRDGSTRFAKAKAALVRAVDGSPAHVHFALAFLAPDPALAVPFSAGRPRVLEALEGAAWKPVPARAAEALPDLAPLAAGRSRPRIWLASDFPRGDVPSALPGSTPVSYLAVGDRRDNLCVASLTGAWGGWWDPRASFFVKFENTGPEPVPSRLEVRDEEEVLFEEERTLGPGESFEATFPVTRREKEIMVTAVVSPGGALALDDRAWCRLPGQEKRRIFLVSEAPTAFVQSAVEGLESLMDKERSGVVAPASWKKAGSLKDILVFEGWGPGESFPPGGALVIGSPPGSLPAPPPGPEVESAAVIEWDRKHPVTQGLSFDNVFFRKVRPLPEGYHPLVATDRGPVVGAREGPGGRAVVLSFSLADTNLGLVSSFPILVRNAVRWVGGESTSGSCPSLQPGCRNLPADTEVRWEIGREGGPGVATLVRGGRPFRVAVNFEDPSESTLDAPSAEGETDFTPSVGRPAGADPWRWFLWIALGFLALDGVLLFFRRG
ncbi:MAG: VWA domain-containing protein [Planctomycetota bacterium]|jgi:hypothetical protein